MSVFSNNLLIGAGGQGTPSFNSGLIPNSIWLDGSADYLSKTFGSTGNQKRFTFAFWTQRSAIDEAAPGLYSAGDGSQNNDFNIYWNNTGGGGYAGNNLIVSQIDGGNSTWRIATSALYRDTAWYHIIVSVDTAESTEADRVKIYVNGDQVTSFVAADYPSEDADVDYVSDSANEQRIGRNQGANYLNGYIAQYTFLDGQSIQNSDVTVASFLDTQTFGDNGSQKIPIKDSSVAALATTAGGNSFMLSFDDSSNLGEDESDNSNNFSLTGIASVNQTTSTPSLSYSVWNPLRVNSQTQTFAEGNLQFSSTQTSTNPAVTGTVGVSTGKYYWEVLVVAEGNGSNMVGICDVAAGLEDDANALYASALMYSYEFNGTKRNNNVSSTYGNSITDGDIVGVALDMDNGGVYFSKNGTFQDSGDPTSGGSLTGAAFTGLASAGSGTFQPYYLAYSNGDGVVNFGQTGTFNGRTTAGGNTDGNGIGNFTYAVPSDYLALVSKNLTAPTYQGIDYFNAVKYAGNGTAIGSGGKAVTGTGFQPDWVWIKNRDAADSHGLYDAVRGTTKQIESDNTSAETTESEGLTAFGSDGFTVGSLAQLNTSSENYVAWQWLGNNSTSSNTDGTLTSTVTTAEADHFSIVGYTGSGANTTVGHGLGAAPEMMICRELPGGDDWNVYHEYNTASPAGVTLRLDTSGATTTDGTLWNSTVPSSTIVNLGTSAETNQDSTAMILYCFRSVAGVCKVGKYTGNGAADGPYIYIGFKPRYFIWKNADVARDWGIIDTATQTYNPGVLSSVLFANLDNADGDGTQGASGTAYNIDILADGFKIRVGDSGPNGDGNDFIYMAMADIGGGGILPPIYGR